MREISSVAIVLWLLVLAAKLDQHGYYINGERYIKITALLHRIDRGKITSSCFDKLAQLVEDVYETETHV